MRRRLRWSLLAVAAALLMAIFAAVWLVRSDGGRDWLLARVIATLPEGATLRWDAIDGSISGPLDIHGIHYDYKGNSFDAARLRINHGFWPLLSRRLEIRTLVLENAIWVLPADDTPMEAPRWPDVLPKLDMPLTVAVAELRVRNLQVRRVTEPLLTFRQIDGGFTLARGSLELRNLRAVSDRGLLRISGHYIPAEDFRTAMRGRLVFPAQPGLAPAAAMFTVKGNINDLALELDGAAPAPVSLRVQLHEGRSDPRWQASAASTRFELQQLGLAPDLAYAFDVRASGKGGKAEVRGTLARGELKATILSSRIALEDGVLVVAPLVVKLDQGNISVRGRALLEGRDPQFDFTARSDKLLLSPSDTSEDAQPVSASGELRMHGRYRAWRVKGNVDLLRAKQKATLVLEGNGDDRHLALTTLQANTPNGDLRGSGSVQWQPTLRVELASRLAGFDPGYFIPDYPGAVNGEFSGQAERKADGKWQGEALLANLGGSLRKRPLQGHGTLRFDGAEADGELSLRIGESHVEAGGHIGDTLDVKATFSPLLLADLWPLAGGRLQGSIAVRGPRAAPGYSAQLQGTAVRWNGIEAAHLDINGRLPASGAGGALRVSATGVALAGRKLDSFEASLSGSLAALRARANAAGDSGTLLVEGSINHSADRWQGRLEQLRLAPSRGATWQLRSGAGFRYAGGALQLDSSCLASSAGGEVCAQANGSRASIHGKGLPLALVEPWIADNTLGLHAFGNVDFDGDFIRARPAAPFADAWDGRLQLRSASGGLRIDPQSPREVIGYSNLAFNAQLARSRLSFDVAAALANSGSISGRGNAGFADGAPLQGELRLDVRQLDWLELFSSDIAGPRGQLTGTLQFGGTLAAPALSGNARLAGFSAELPALGVKLQAGDFTLRGEPGGQARLTGQVTSGSGQLRVDGTVNLADRSSPIELQLRGENITVADTPDLQGTMSPDLRLRYADGTLQIRGKVDVPTARIDLERLDQSVSVSPDVVVLDPRELTARSVLLVDTEVDLVLGDDVQLRGFGLDGRLRGNLRIRDRPGREPIANGSLDVSGTYSAYGRALQIKRGRLSFVNSSYDNPTLDILAEREFEEVTAGVRVRGTALAPVTTVTSSPSMPTAEALSWLVIGRPLSSASGSEAQSISASAIALSAGSNLLAQRIGARLGLDSAGVVENRALGGSTFVVGKKISARLFVTYGLSLIGTGQVLTLKYLLKRGLDVSLESGTVETAGSINWRKEK